MCAAPSCYRSALVHAFRPSSSKASSVLTVPDFLVPAAFARPAIRPFSGSRPHRAGTHVSTRSSSSTIPAESIRPIHASKSSRTTSSARISLPGPNIRHHVQPWLAALEPYLPRHLRQHPNEGSDIVQDVGPVGLSWFLYDAQEVAHDILGHIGLVENRWETLIWIVKKLVEDGTPIREPLQRLNPFVHVAWSNTDAQSLNELTNSPLEARSLDPRQRLTQSLDDATAAPDFLSQDHTAIKQGVGQLWQSLGNMILVATQEHDVRESQIMQRVLEIIAYLHHAGLIPESVYAQRPNAEEHALQQPPTLHLLSSQILTALSDATWRAHEASVKVARQKMNASYFLGHEIPGSRYKVRVTGVAAELWLELVLWSCLHGGWILNGAAILERMFSQGRQGQWSITSWRELLQTKDEPSPVHGWGLFNRKADAEVKAEDRTRTKRTISSEIVTALIDGLVNTMRVGVGSRGTHPENLVNQIKNLKRGLDSHSLSLGSATWDSLMIRLVESGGIIPEKRPELLLSTVELASEFGSEVASANASFAASGPEAQTPYFFEPSTVSLSLLHRTMRSFVANGDISGAMAALTALQEHTDKNKQKSLQQFFTKLKASTARNSEPFSGPPIQFPSFDPQLPVPLLAKLLDLVTQTKLYHLGRLLLFSEDLDGPLIRREMFSDPTMAASILRYGTMAGENDLVMKIVKTGGTFNTKTNSQRLPATLLTALLCSQIKLHRWESVRGMQNYVLDNPGYRPRSEVLAVFAAEILRLSNGSFETEGGTAREAHRSFLFAWEGLVLTQMRNQLYCILGIMSSVDAGLKKHCGQFLAFSDRQEMQLSTDDFNEVLGGVLGGYGSLKGKEIVDMWCHKAPRLFEPYRAPGGLSGIPRFRIGRGQEYDNRPEDIVVTQPSGTELRLQGRIHPNRQTVWAVLRQVQHEEEQRTDSVEEPSMEHDSQVRETLRWATRLLYYLGHDYEDIRRDLGSLAERAQLHAPPSQEENGGTDGREGL